MAFCSGDQEEKLAEDNNNKLAEQLYEAYVSINLKKNSIIKHF